MPSKNFKLPYLHDVNDHCIDLCDEIAQIVDAIDEHLAKAEIPVSGKLQTEGLFYDKVGDMVTVYGTCSPASFIVARMPFKPVLHKDAQWIPLVFYKTDGMTPLNARMTGEGTLLCNGAVNNEITVQFTFATLD